MYRSWRITTWNHLFFLFFSPGLAGFGGRLGDLGWVYFFLKHIVASSLLARIALLHGIRSDRWPYDSFRWSEIWWVNSSSAHFNSVHLGGTFSFSPWRNPDFFANPQMSQGWLLRILPSAGKFQHFSFTGFRFSSSLEQVGCGQSCLGRWLLTLLNRFFWAVTFTNNS